MTMHRWVKLPTVWIREKKGLRDLRWTPKEGADNLAALMTLIVIAHHADEVSGLATLTYNQLSQYTALSRAKVSGGLKILEAKKLLTRRPSGRSSLQLADYDPKWGWAKLPALKLYSTASCVSLFSELTLRKPAELHALKLYLLFVAMRNRDTNLACISYDKIEDYTDIDRSRIKTGLSILAAHGLVHVEHLPTADGGIANAYRVTHIEPYRHMGTMGRGFDTADTDASGALIPAREPSSGSVSGVGNSVWSQRAIRDPATGARVALRRF